MAAGTVECILARVMREKGVSVNQLSIGTGIPAARIISYMNPNNKTFPKGDDAGKIASFLGVDISYIWRPIINI